MAVSPPIVAGGMGCILPRVPAIIVRTGDELPYGPYANLSIRTVFGAFKERYPDLRTVATINWPTICMGCHGAPATPSSAAIGSGARGGPNGPKPGDPDGIGDDFPIDVCELYSP